VYSEKDWSSARESDAKEKTKGERRSKDQSKAKQEFVLLFFPVHMHAETRTGIFSPLDQVRITLEERFLAGL
jgi:hypothetical protein